MLDNWFTELIDDALSDYFLWGRWSRRSDDDRHAARTGEQPDAASSRHDAANDLAP